MNTHGVESQSERARFGSQRFHDALCLATEWHATQRRTGTAIPYIAHLLAVAALVLEHGGTEDEAIAALLHDAIEDQEGAPTRNAIRRHFGEAVVQIVDGCTDAEVTPKPPWRARKEAYRVHLATASPAVLLVAVADTLHHARAILADYRALGDALWPRCTANKDEIPWYYRGLAAAFRARNGLAPRALVDELERVAASIEATKG